MRLRRDSRARSRGNVVLELRGTIYAVRVELEVGAIDADALDHGPRNENAVKGIFVMKW
jgi:hypothetical protein